MERLPISDKGKKLSLTLYKYCKIPERKNWSSLIEEVKFKKISELNDPFEGFLRVRDEEGKIIQRISPSTFIASFSKTKPYSLSGEEVQEIQKNLYMWSHYCDSMNGICIEYHHKKSKKNKSYQSGKVKYIERIPKEITAFHKYVSWSFEEEYRFSYIEKGRKTQEDFKSTQSLNLKVKAVYLGVRLLGKKVRFGTSEKIKNLMSDHPFVLFMEEEYPGIKLFICVRHRSSFRIVRYIKPHVHTNKK